MVERAGRLRKSAGMAARMRRMSPNKTETGTAMSGKGAVVTGENAPMT